MAGIPGSRALATIGSAIAVSLRTYNGMTSLQLVSATFMVPTPIMVSGAVRPPGGSQLILGVASKQGNTMYYGFKAEVLARLDMIIANQVSLLKQGVLIVSTLQDDIAAIAAQTTAVDSLTVFVKALQDKILARDHSRDAGPD